ncbi:MAG: hypothetical protein R2863_08120 [Candidatus Kapaibacterium sp.]|nr:hypothetical protein [Ignavibacteriota bacterium]MCB9220462.1 hypothetical protein [Ignavibacteria bacterium]
MKNYIIIALMVCTFSAISAKSIVLKNEKSIDSGKTFFSIKNNIQKWSYRELPSQQKLTDYTKGVALYSYNNGQTWSSNNKLESKNIVTSDLVSYINIIKQNSTLIQLIDYTGKKIEIDNFKNQFGIYFVTFINGNKIFITTIMVTK